MRVKEKRKGDGKGKGVNQQNEGKDKTFYLWHLGFGCTAQERITLSRTRTRWADCYLVR